MATQQALTTPDASAAGLMGKVGQAAVGRDKEHPHQRQQDGENLKHPRPAPLLDADHQQNNDRGEVLQDRPHASAGQLDRQ